MKINNEKKPEAGNKLYENLFNNRDDFITIKLISDGLLAIKGNIARLLDDVCLLTKKNKFSSAHFLLTTANEEISKLYILLDMCRLDFKKYESVLRCLCRAFYDHVLKHSYIEIQRLNWGYDFSQIQEIWGNETRKWWASDAIESGEPDIPHDTYFSREMPLYVDYIEYDKKWHSPSNKKESYHFEEMFGQDALSISKQHLNIINTTDDMGLFLPQSLSILHSIFEKKYISNNINNDDLKNLYIKVNEKMNKDLDITVNLFETIIFSIPLYHFLT